MFAYTRRAYVRNHTAARRVGEGSAMAKAINIRTVNKGCNGVETHPHSEPDGTVGKGFFLNSTTRVTNSQRNCNNKPTTNQPTGKPWSNQTCF